MKKIKVNADVLIAQAINRPCVDKIPLYTRVDGGNDTGFSGSSKTEKWLKASDNNYNSPTNIRKVFITGDKVVTQLYRPIKKSGAFDTAGCWREYKMTGTQNLFKCVESQVKYESNMRKYYMEKQINRDAEEPVYMEITGKGLRALSHPWVLSNIEELYFDWTLLAAEGNKNDDIKCSEILSACLNRKKGNVRDAFPLNLFLSANEDKSLDWRSKYPRLKCVALISNLKFVLRNNFDRGKPGIDSIEDSLILWYQREKNLELIKNSNSLFIVSDDIRDKSDANKFRYSLREGIYKYDRDVLAEYFREVEGRYNDWLFERRRRNMGDIDNTVSKKSDLELLLDDVESKVGSEEALKVLVMTMANIKEAEIFDGMSVEGAVKYRKMLGGK